MRTIIIGNGTLWQPDYERGLIGGNDHVICANGGSRNAHALGIVPHRLIGDADSLPEGIQAWLEANNVPWESHPHEKDETDLELALSTALAEGATEVIFLGATGTRVDHSFANISLLARARRSGIAAEIVAGYQHCRLIWDETILLIGEADQTISLLPWGGDADGVSAQGVKWPLHHERLRFGEARGVSNLFVGTDVHISVTQGCLLIVHHRGPVE